MKPLKNRYTPEFIAAFCLEVTSVYPKFEAQKFSQFVFDETWHNKELKARMHHIALGLKAFLPNNYQQSIAILTQVCGQLESCIDGFLLMFLPDFVESFGLEDYPISIQALAIFTPIASGEFAVRAFIKRYPDKTIQQLRQWAKSDNKHLRRLASEGCRPRLPWACALPAFKQNPKPILPILERLKNDPNAYVRRSVANNLNDISKDNPNIVIGIAQKWFGETQPTDRLIKHACRTLLKQAQPEIMALFGFLPAPHIQTNQFQAAERVKIGQFLPFSFALDSTHRLGKLRIEYAIDFVKNNGSLTRKIFKISEANYKETHKIIRRKHSFKLISTRKYYLGTHHISLIINGVVVDSKMFLLQGVA